MSNSFSLADMGWQNFFQQQLSLEEWDSTIPFRIVEQQRSQLQLIGEGSSQSLPVPVSAPPLVVGDWLLLNDAGRFERALDRRSCFQRKAAGTAVRTQLIAANVDTALIVCSLNEDFSLNRIERYLAIVKDAGAEAVVILSKRDLNPHWEECVQEVQALDPLLMVHALDCRSPEVRSVLAPWLARGQTVSLLGSSGTGKSTLCNTLGQSLQQLTGGIRDQDGKGRHTTTARSMIPLADGGWLIDTPGMRELQLGNCSEGLSESFADIGELAAHCRFSDCSHNSEPGCAVASAVEQGTLSQRRLANYRKLIQEDARNSASLAESRARDKALSRMYRRVLRESTAIKKG